MSCKICNEDLSALLRFSARRSAYCATKSHAHSVLLKLVDGQKKDWNKFYGQAVEFHIKNAESRANAQLGVNVIGQIDPAFNMEDAVSARAKSAFI